MKAAIMLPVGATLAITLVGCGAGQPSSQPSATAPVGTTRPASTTTPKAAPDLATANESVFADQMAASISNIPATVVSGELMQAYVRFENAYSAAWGAVGQPDSSATVTQVPDGFTLCYTGSSGSTCERLTDFTTNQAGQITELLVDNQAVAGRVAVGPAATSDGLTISDVVALRFAGAPNLVGVAFKLTDTSYRPVNENPALLASLGGASPGIEDSALPATLAPGDSLYAGAAFDITQVTGLFCLQPNDGFGEQLPCTTLRKI